MGRPFPFIMKADLPASIRNENASKRSKVILHISRMSQSDLRIVLPSHLGEQQL